MHLSNLEMVFVGFLPDGIPYGVHKQLPLAAATGYGVPVAGGEQTHVGEQLV
jgi:hypothetical protein